MSTCSSTGHGVDWNAVQASMAPSPGVETTSAPAREVAK